MSAQEEIFSVPKSVVAREFLYKALKYRWSLHARKAQNPDDALRWNIWLYLAGRGTGKTRSGAEKIRSWVERGIYGRIHFVAPTAADVRDTMVEGESGILAISHPKFYPLYEPSKRKLTWPNGAIALLFSADKPDRMRGPQCDAFWADELCAWRYMRNAWDMLMFGFRLGKNPRGIITTTPRPVPVLKDAMKMDHVIVTHETSYANKANLAAPFFKYIVSQYEGSRLGRQEIGGEILGDNPNALWNRDWFEKGRVTRIPALTRICVGVDPAVSATEESNETGIIVVGKDNREPAHYYILDDCTVEKASPHTWGSAAVAAYRKWCANKIVAEVNNGGDMVASTIENIDSDVPVTKVHASHGKLVRAEPVSTLTEQGRLHCVGFFPKMEDQCCEWEPKTDQKSPDRLDAMVWAVTSLMDGKGGFRIGKVA